MYFLKLSIREHIGHACIFIVHDGISQNGAHLNPVTINQVICRSQIAAWVLTRVMWEDYRAFLNLWFGKSMVCVRVAFHENDGNHENDENDEGQLRRLQTRSRALGSRKSREPRKWRKPRESRVQTTGSPNHVFFFFEIPKISVGRYRTTPNPKARRSLPVFWPLFPLYARAFFPCSTALFL